MNSLLQEVIEGRRLTFAEGCELLANGDWLELGQAAWEIRKRKLGDETASYTMFRVVNYTNICTIDCKFCSFQDEVDSKFAYVLTQEQVFQKVEEALAQGADQMFFQGGVHPSLPFSYYTEILSAVKKQFGIHIRAFSPVELLNLSQLYALPLTEVITRLKDAGMDSIPGAGAELLVERLRLILSPKKCTSEQWREVMTQCHRLGLPGSATMVIGGGETSAEIVEHLEVIRQIQDETQGFHSFIPWVYQQQTKRFKALKVRPDEYLKVLAFSRIYLDNIENLEVSVLVLGKDIAKIALRFGANDISSVVIEENVLKSYGLRTEKEAQQFIKEAGFKSVRRDFNYHVVAPIMINAEAEFNEATAS